MVEMVEMQPHQEQMDRLIDEVEAEEVEVDEVYSYWQLLLRERDK